MCIHVVETFVMKVSFQYVNVVGDDDDCDGDGNDDDPSFADISKKL